MYFARKLPSDKINFSLGLEPKNQKGELDCEISGPDGNPVEADVSKLGPDGPFQVSYIPTGKLILCFKILLLEDADLNVI